MKSTTIKMLAAFVIMVFSVSLSEAQCTCYCSTQPKNNAICVTDPNNGNSHCKHVGPRYCGRFGDATSISDATSLEDIYPNPVSGSATIFFYAGQPENVSLKILDVNGKLVTILADAYFEKGDHEITWNAAEVNSGIYFLRMEVSDHSEYQKLIVTK